MKTMSLKLWSLLVVAAVGFSAMGCAAEASTEEASEGDAITVERDLGSVNDVAEEPRVETHQGMNAKVLEQMPMPGEPVAEATGGVKITPPNPCPGQAAPVPEPWR